MKCSNAIAWFSRGKPFKSTNNKVNSKVNNKSLTLWLLRSRPTPPRAFSSPLVPPRSLLHGARLALARTRLTTIARYFIRHSRRQSFARRKLDYVRTENRCGEKAYNLARLRSAWRLYAVTSRDGCIWKSRRALAWIARSTSRA